MSDSDRPPASAVHALDGTAQGTRHRRKGSEPVKSLSQEADGDCLDQEQGGDDASVEPNGYEDCLTFVIVIAMIGGMIAFFGYLFVQMAAPGDLSQRLQNIPQVEAKHMDVHVTLAQLYSGHSTQIEVDRQLVCRHCAGTGVNLKEGYHQCHDCNGSGVRTFVQQIGPFKQHVRAACNVCKGKGQVANKHCDVCHGHGHLRDRKQFDVAVERGMKHGDTVVLPREGDQSMRALPADVVIHLRMAPHRQFTRRGDDLEIELEISLLEALVGFKRELVHLDNGRVELTREEVTAPDSVWRIPSQGMPVRGATGQFGDLLVRFLIQYPASLTSEEKLAVGELLAV